MVQVSVENHSFPKNGKSQPELEKTHRCQHQDDRILSDKDIKGVILKIFQGPVINMIKIHFFKKENLSKEIEGKGNFRIENYTELGN